MKFSISQLYSFIHTSIQLQATSGGQKTDFADFWHFHEKSQRQEIKKLVASEEELIKAIIKTTTVEYFASSKGYWYSYETMNELDTLTPKRGYRFL
jgi:hypothetical protein